MACNFKQGAIESPPAPLDNEKDAVMATRRKELRYLNDFAVVSVLLLDLGLYGSIS
jgi:hypothetical protein